MYLHRPMTPVKTTKVDDREKIDEVNESDLETNKNKIKLNVTNLNKVTDTPKIPGKKAGSHISFSRKPSLERHKGF